MYTCWNYDIELKSIYITQSVHSITLLLLVLTTGSLLEFEYAITKFYWVIVALSVFSYFNAALRNPGYVGSRVPKNAPKTVTVDGMSKHRKTNTAVSINQTSQYQAFDALQSPPASSEQTRNINGEMFAKLENTPSEFGDKKLDESLAEIDEPLVADESSPSPEPQGAKTLFGESLGSLSDSDADYIMSEPDPSISSRVVMAEDGVPITDDRRYQLPPLPSQVKEKITNSALEKTTDQGSETVIMPENRYWTICNVEQPMRAKHCKECGQCVNLHDHHCPWLGSCIGERNRFFFWWYLCFQCIELWLSLIACCAEFKHYTGVISNFILGISIHVFVLLTLVLFTLMVSALLGFHTYLAIKNQTTWESVSWRKITYLKNWPTKLGSPFSRGCLINLHLFCCAWRLAPFKWILPQNVPTRAPRNCICC